MSKHLCDFAAEMRQSIAEFEAAYATKAIENPEHYPLELPDDNAGLWFEFFTEFCLTGNV